MLGISAFEKQVPQTFSSQCFHNEADFIAMGHGLGEKFIDDALKVSGQIISWALICRMLGRF